MRAPLAIHDLRSDITSLIKLNHGFHDTDDYALGVYNRLRSILTK
jgi:hypothetical protein